jgi:hypothetical protein
MQNEKQIKSKLFAYIKKNSLFISLAFLSIFLMLIFRHNKSEISQFFESSKNSLISLYTSNLRPLLASTEITTDDVFNFAVYQEIPVDKQKVLIVSDNTSGDLIYEIQPKYKNENKNSYEQFKNYLNLTELENEKVDSILNSYKDEIYSSILVNDKNTIAASPKLASLQKLLLTEIILFAENVGKKTNSHVIENLIDFDINKIHKYSTQIKTLPKEDYIFITPDTVFQRPISFSHFTKGDGKDYLKKLNEVKVDVKQEKPKAKSKIPHPASFKYSIHLDTNLVKVVIPLPSIVLALGVEDSIKVNLEKVAEKLRNIKLELNEKKKKMVFVESHLKPKEPSKVFNFNNPSDVERYTEELLSKFDLKKWEEFGIKMDSLGKAFKFTFEDSLIIQNKAFNEYQNKIKKLKEARNKSKTRK